MRSPSKAPPGTDQTGQLPAVKDEPPAPGPERPPLSEREIRELRSKWNRIWTEQMDEARRDLAATVSRVRAAIERHRPLWSLAS